MGFDLLWALPLGLLGGCGVWLAFRARRIGDPRARYCGLALLPLLALVAAAGYGDAFDGYRSDLWVYLTVVERVADGEWLFFREPYGLEPPGGPHHSLNWLAAGLVRRATGIEGRSLVLALRWLSLLLLSYGAYRLASRAFAPTHERLMGVFCFWSATPRLWTEIGLNRSFAGVWLLLATASALGYRGTPGESLRVAVFLALAFWTHFFGGLLALGAVALAWLARLREGPRIPSLRLAGAVAGGLALASPWIALYLAKSGAQITESYLWGPGQLRVAGLRWLNPLQLLRETSPPLLLLAVFGLLGPPAARLSPVARTACRAGAAAVAGVLLTPLYHVWSQRLGGWLALRLLTLGFLWLPAAASLLWLLAAGEERSRRARSALALGFCVALVWLGAARVVRDFRHPELYGHFSAEAQREARGLRAILRDHSYVSVPTLAYALAPHTLGHPLAVPPGRASPFHDFSRRDARVRQVLRANTPACWAALLAEYPGLEYFVAPAAGARDEEHLWRVDVPEADAGAERATLAKVVGLEPVHRGSHYAVDRIVRRALPPGDCPE